jgi:ABC-2 type transport system permease protein
MNKLLTIALKDLTLAFRDRAALILMLAAPMTLTLGLGLVTGRFSGGDNTRGLRDIPVAVVNQDDGPLGRALADALASSDLNGLIEPITVATADDARQRVADDEAAAAVIIPAGFTASVTDLRGLGDPGGLAHIELHANPARPVSAGVAQSVVERFLGEVEANRLSAQVAVEQMVASGRLQPADVPATVQALAQRQSDEPNAITIEHTTESGAPPPAFDPLAFLAPGMALLFLMYTVTRGGAQLLAERDGGTLARLFISPTAMPMVLGGKVAGIFLTAVAQVAILIGSSTVLFDLRWGDPLGLVLLVPAVALAATGWGMLLTSFVKTPQQIGGLGSAVMLVFGVLGGSFGNFQLPGALQALGRITPNAWGIQGFAALGDGGALADVLPNVLALLAIAAVTFAIAVVLFRRNGFVKK